jgi:uncharacterized protein
VIAAFFSRRSARPAAIGALRFVLAVALSFCAETFFAAEVLPQKPARYFNDYARVVSSRTGETLNRQLENFERETSSQIVVAVYPKMESDSSIDDFTFRTAQSWGVGQKGTNNGAVLFVFIQDRKMFIQVGYGLEGALPDALCKRIVENEIKPRFKAGDYDGGLAAGVNAMMAAAKGEYKGTGRTVADTKGAAKSSKSGLLIFIVVIVLISLFSRRRRTYGWFGGGWGGGGWSIGSGGGGFSSGGGGGFSGGGGSFGGGGAGGSW